MSSGKIPLSIFSLIFFFFFFLSSANRNNNIYIFLSFFCVWFEGGGGGAWSYIIPLEPKGQFEAFIEAAAHSFWFRSSTVDCWLLGSLLVRVS
jgi:hypothetical protein